MNYYSFKLVLTGMLLNTIAQLLLKRGTNLLPTLKLSSADIFNTIVNVISNYFILGGVLCYVLSLGVWIMVLSRLEVSVAYPLLSIGYVINLFAAYYFFGEQLSLMKLLGVALIVAGVYFITQA